MDRQYKIRYGDDQHTKVATKNMVPVIEQTNPVETIVDADDVIEEDTGLTQQHRTENRSMDKDTPGTDNQEEDDRPGSNEVSYPEYPGEQDHQHGELDAATIVSTATDPWDEHEMEIDDPDEPDPGYPDSIEVNVDIPQHPEETTRPGGTKHVRAHDQRPRVQGGRAQRQAG